MTSKSIIGLGFGDEGKGLTTDYLCSQFPSSLVIRFSGGQQAGHTVVRNNLHHVFSNFGSGTLLGIPTYWSKFCTFEPIGFINELKSLLDIGVSPFIYIDEQCPITTPYDMLHNQSIDMPNGTCGVGVGTTKQREENHYSFTFGDLFYPWVYNTKLNLIKNYYGDTKVSLKRFDACVETVVNSKHIFRIKELPPQYNHYIFEGSQGLLLDQNYGFFPHVTRSNTGTKNLLEMGINPELYLITRAYQTRHGNGPMSNETIPHNIKIDENETNIENKYQGKFRRSLLDIDLLLYGISKDAYINESINRTLVITCLDHIENEYRFTYKGNIEYCNSEDDFIYKVSNLLGMSNILISRSNESKNILQWKK
jgi:adenylosuccinate synthase